MITIPLSGSFFYQKSYFYPDVSYSPDLCLLILTLAQAVVRVVTIVMKTHNERREPKRKFQINLKRPMIITYEPIERNYS